MEGVNITVIKPSGDVLALVVPESQLRHPLGIREPVGKAASVYDQQWRVVYYEGVEYRDRKGRSYWVFVAQD